MAIFPGSVATDTDLFIAVNDQATALTGSLTSGTTSIPVTSTTGFPASGYLSIDSEIMHYSAIADSTHFTVDVRGADGTSAAAHSSVTAVYHNVIAAHHNALKDEIKAIETYLGTAVSATEFSYLDGVTSAIQTQLGTKATDSLVMHLAGTETVTGAKTFSSIILGANGSVSAPTYSFTNATNAGVYWDGTDLALATNGVKFLGVGSSHQRVQISSPATPTVNFLISGDGSSFTFAGGGVNITQTTNQITFGGAAAGHVIILSVATPATADRTWTLPDISSDGTFAALQGSQTFSGTKTFSAAPVISALTASTVPYLDASKILTSSSVTPTELGYLSGVTSAIQTQLGLLAPLASPTFTGTVTAAIANFSGKVSANNTAGNPIHGTNTSDDAASAYVGEYVTSYQNTSTAFPTSTQYGDLTSISLTAGDWDIWVMANPQENGGTTSTYEIGFSSTTGNSSTGLSRGNTSLNQVVTTPLFPSCALLGRVSISSTTIYYLKYEATYTGAAPVARGTISARRRR